MKDALGDFQAIIEKLVSLFSALGALTAILVVLPVSLWFAWARHSAVAYALVQTLFCAVFGWGVVSAFKLQRGLLKLSPSDRPRALWTAPGRCSGTVCLEVGMAVHVRSHRGGVVHARNSAHRCFHWQVNASNRTRQVLINAVTGHLKFWCGTCTVARLTRP